jgi:hypothetical protein
VRCRGIGRGFVPGCLWLEIYKYPTHRREREAEDCECALEFPAVPEGEDDRSLSHLGDKTWDGDKTWQMRAHTLEHAERRPYFVGPHEYLTEYDAEYDPGYDPEHNPEHDPEYDSESDPV